MWDRLRNQKPTSTSRQEKSKYVEKRRPIDYPTKAMTIHISLTPETEAKLRQYAQAAGMDISAFILDVLEQKLSETRVVAIPSNGDSNRILQELDPDVWQGIDPVEYQRREREGWD